MSKILRVEANQMNRGMLSVSIGRPPLTENPEPPIRMPGMMRLHEMAPVAGMRIPRSNQISNHPSSFERASTS